MTEAVTAVVALVFGAVLVLERRSRDRQEQAWVAERADLLQRIQAPEQAVITHATLAPESMVVPAAFDDDDDALKAWEQIHGD